MADKALEVGKLIERLESYRKQPIRTLNSRPEEDVQRQEAIENTLLDAILPDIRAALAASEAEAQALRDEKARLASGKQASWPGENSNENVDHLRAEIATTLYDVYPGHDGVMALLARADAALFHAEALRQQAEAQLAEVRAENEDWKRKRESYAMEADRLTAEAQEARTERDKWYDEAAQRREVYNALMLEQAEKEEAQQALRTLREALEDAVEVARNYYMLFHDETWETRLTKWSAALAAVSERKDDV